MIRSTAVALTALLLPVGANAAPVYLNEVNTVVEVGVGTSAGSFNNTFAAGQTINKVIDAPSADAEEFHNQTTHIWYTADAIGGGLELVFTFDQSYDISMLHFWNYTSEGYDVDNVDFDFFNAAGTLVGDLSLEPALGSTPGIRAEDIPLLAPLNVKMVTAFLTGSNREVDFQNIGFTAEVSAPPAVPLPAAAVLLATGLGALGAARIRRRR